MKSIALVNIRTEQLKKILFPVLEHNNFKILEVTSVRELQDFYLEHKDDIGIYVQEFDDKNKAESFGRINIIDRENTSVLLLVSELDTGFSEKASSLGVKDVVRYPFAFEVLDRRIKRIIESGTKIPVKTVKKLPEEDSQDFNFDTLNDEISRSRRGHYPVMIVVVTHSKYINNKDEKFIENLKKHIRTTDTIEIYNNNTIIIYCPFTPKANYEILKSKIQESFTSYNNDKRVNANYISALTFPDDFEGDGKESEILKSQISDNSLYFEVDNPNNNIDLQAIRNRIRRNFITYE